MKKKVILTRKYQEEAIRQLREAFDLMKPGAIFIHVARRDIVDEACPAEKLEKKELFGAGLDVYEFEPKVTEKLKSLDNESCLN